MATPVILPALGESVTEGSVTRWHKQVGDVVALDEPLLEISTDKVDTEIPSPVAGVMIEINAAEDQTVVVGGQLCVIGDQVENGGSTSEEPPGHEALAQTPTVQPALEGGFRVTLPELGESVTDGTVTRWLRRVGDTVAVDEPLLEVSTDKVDAEVPSPAAGTLLELNVAEGETVKIGAQLAVIGATVPTVLEAPAQAAPTQQGLAVENGNLQPQRPKHDVAADAPVVLAPTQPKVSNSRPTVVSGDVGNYATPLVRRMAAEHNVDLASIRGSGVGGRIRKQDVLLAAAETGRPASAPPSPSAPPTTTEPGSLRGRIEPLSRLRKVIATRMVQSLTASAQLTQVMEVDVTRVARLRDDVKGDFLAREGVKLTYLPFFAKAAIDALKQHPKLNANIDSEAGEVIYFDYESVAFAVDTERGLLTPVVNDAGELSIAGLAKKIADLAERTRTGKIAPDELTGGTFTITNLGTFGALFDTPIINQPQVAILGPGTVVKRPVVIDDPNLGETIAVRFMVNLALTYDHRLVDGADAGRFLSDVKARLEAAQFEV